MYKPPKAKKLNISALGHNEFVIEVLREDNSVFTFTVERDELMNLKDVIEALLEVI